jgi:hypothetical protein
MQVNRSTTLLGNWTGYRFVQRGMSDAILDSQPIE